MSGRGWRLALAVVIASALSGCGQPAPRADPDQVDSVQPPELGACRQLTLADISEAANATPTVPCSQDHTAQTYAVGEMPADTFSTADYDAPEVGAFAFETCTRQLEKFLGGDVSLSMRSIVTWAWFRPSESAWAEGARWYRCDAVGGGEQSAALVTLPETARGLLQGRPDDKWLACVQGPSVDSGAKIPCTQPHDWRAVTTIKLGEPEDPYPGDRIVEVKTRDFCSDSVGAWLNYPVDFDYGYTWFHQAEWDAGNRRSVCWAKTDD
ncbi:MAG: septum formation family protein [Nocardioides sp.]